MKPPKRYKGIKYLFVLFIITCFLFTLFLLGCNQTPAPEPTTTNQDTTSELAPESSQSTTPQTKQSEPSPPYTLELSFPNGAPALNQVAEFKVIAVHKTRDMNDVRIDLILPEGFELLSGDLSWSANSLPYGETEVINALVKANKTGNWTIEARLNEAQSTSYPEGGARHPIYVSVLEDSAEWGITPPWYSSGGVEVPVKKTKPGES